MYCIYINILDNNFCDVKYALILIESLYISDYHYHIVINTNEKYQKKIIESYFFDSKKIKFINNYDEYDTVLILEPKTFVKSNINDLFDIIIDNIIYVNNTNKITLFKNTLETKIYLNIINTNDKNINFSFVNSSRLNNYGANIINFNENSLDMYDSFITFKNDKLITPLILKCNDYINFDARFKNIINILLNKKIKNILVVNTVLDVDVLLMLKTNPKVKITCVVGNYNVELYDKIIQNFKDSIDIIKGDSIDILPHFKNKDKYDLIYINSIPAQFNSLNDIMNSYYLANDKSLIIMNNYKDSNINNIWNIYSDKLLFKEIDINTFPTDSQIIKMI
jgi:hypothetical protein